MPKAEVDAPQPESRFVIGTRGSRLALWQANHVADRLNDAGLRGVDIEVLSTKGDRVLDVPLAEIGDKGLFTAELDAALLDGRLDLAVHSLKDLPTTLPDGLVLAAVTAREDPSDAFVAHPDYVGRLGQLPYGATLATSSLRRRAQLLAWRPDLRIVSVRGNVPTRVGKLDASGALASPPSVSGWHGAILASAGLVRLELADRIRDRIPPSVMIPAVGQGALGIVCRANAPDTRRQLADALQDASARAACDAERALLRQLEGGCQVPVAANARVTGADLVLDASVVSLDGREAVRDRIEGPAADAVALGERLAARLVEAGASAILDAIRAA